MNYLFTNILGSFVLDEKIKIVDSIVFKDADEYLRKEKSEAKLQKKHNTQPLPQEKIAMVLSLFKDKRYYQDFYTKNLQLTKQAIKNSVNEDQLILQTIGNISELDKVSNILVKRLREWHSWYYPELSENVSSHEKYIDLVLEGKRNTTMGADLGEEHVEEMMLLAKEIRTLYDLRKKHEKYLEQIMKPYCPNLLELAGATIGAKLIELARGLKRLAMLPASTIQLLGAEKALFRHLKTKSRSPKYGVLFQHPFVQKAQRQERGKMARVLADKLSLCARLDYFKGEFKAPEYKKMLEEKIR
ncbi:hypothetical protein J4228_01165 [Candidatus Woesearchaeota archaeon]|nr:hypothetical protein [Candidatus Woesearchaeota archaeon]